jgi:uncharacterized protein YsxB (DUF464 family)
MIKVSVFQDQAGIQGYEVKGHAGYAEAGQDIVCAGVSAVTHTALLGLEKYLPNRFQYQINQGGFMKCELATGLAPEEFHIAQVILATMLLGLKSIKAEYGNYIEIALQEVK